jgi:ABC-type polysaccharide transport system permease subunit
MSSAAGFIQSVCGFILVVITNHVVKKTTKESLF